MIEQTEFGKKQIVFIFSNQGDKLTFRNDNLVVKDKEGKVKYQITCYRIFLIYIVGETSITTGLVKCIKKYDIVICLMTKSFRMYSVIGNRMEGNTLLHRKQYFYTGERLAQFIVENKILNQRQVLNSLRNKTDACKEAINKLDVTIERLKKEEYPMETLLGMEGSASRVYFPQIFSNVQWKGRKPRVKFDYVNTTMDIAYSLLFNVVDSLLQVYGFDVYLGVYHKEFYMRKSLVCDLMEPMRPIMDLRIRKAINLHQCKEEDFTLINHQYMLEYKKSAGYVKFLMEEILEHKNEMFTFIQSYYRSFMKGKDAREFRKFTL